MEPQDNQVEVGLFADSTSGGSGEQDRTKLARDSWPPFFEIRMHFSPPKLYASRSSNLVDANAALVNLNKID
jgi:hypothetical protein